MRAISRTARIERQASTRPSSPRDRRPGGQSACRAKLLPKIESPSPGGASANSASFVYRRADPPPRARRRWSTRRASARNLRPSPRAGPSAGRSSRPLFVWSCMSLGRRRSRKMSGLHSSSSRLDELAYGHRRAPRPARIAAIRARTQRRPVALSRSPRCDGRKIEALAEVVVSRAGRSSPAASATAFPRASRCRCRRDHALAEPERSAPRSRRRRRPAQPRQARRRRSRAPAMRDASALDRCARGLVPPVSRRALRQLHGSGSRRLAAPAAALATTGSAILRPDRAAAPAPARDLRCSRTARRARRPRRRARRGQKAGRLSTPPGPWPGRRARPGAPRAVAGLLLAAPARRRGPAPARWPTAVAHAARPNAPHARRPRRAGLRRRASRSRSISCRTRGCWARLCGSTRPAATPSARKLDAMFEEFDILPTRRADRRAKLLPC